MSVQLIVLSRLEEMHEIDASVASSMTQQVEKPRSKVTEDASLTQ